VNSEDWARIQNLFHTAMRLPEAEREAFARRACASEPTLLGELLSLFAVRENSAMLDRVIGEAALEVGTPGAHARIGSYEILREIGRGGAGIVYLAERADGQYQKQVAIKVVRLSYASKDLEARFRAERQILANLDHPNIARLLDGGTLGTGQPYLVMEYVAGETLNEYWRSRNLPILDRLALFLQICAAVEYAHRHGVVHRDLKPSNILVNADGTVKLLDFGTAKVMSQDQLNRTLTQDRRLTPAYASPEQILNHPIGPASDIYSLGVILYELIAGRHPFEADWGTPFAMERAICEKEPPRPNEAITASGLEMGKGEPRDVSALKDALDAIVWNAMRKDPAERYQTVAELAGDVGALRAFDTGGKPALARRRGARLGQRVARRSPLWVWLVAGIVVAAAAGWFVMKRAGSGATDQPLHVEWLTRLPHDEYRASFSPDGSRVVFCWSGYDDVETYLWIKQVGGNAVTRLTSKGRDEYPAWSPDGKWIAFVRSLKDVMLIPSIGGVERKIGETSTFYLSTHVRNYGDVFRQAATASRLPAILVSRA
jgi:serine/threonine-protein kinase